MIQKIKLYYHQKLNQKHLSKLQMLFNIAFLLLKHQLYTTM